MEADKATGYSAEYNGPDTRLKTAIEFKSTHFILGKHRK